MELSEARKQLKSLGFNLKTKRLSWGPHATITNSDRSENLPTIFFSEEDRLKWLPAIEWRTTITEPITNNGETVYGLQSKSLL